jgi:hypothetical protein
MEVTAPQLADYAHYCIEPDERFSLADHDPGDTDGMAGPDDVAREYEEIGERIADLQERLYAEEKRSLLVVLQGTDAAGKDGTVKHVLRGTNPAGVRVYSFKEPSSDELAHDFLWRYHQATPANGMIHVFNRSHYEDVLVVRVKDHDRQVPPAHLQGGAAGEVPRAPGAAGQVLEVVVERRQGARALGRLPAGLRGRRRSDVHAVGAVVRRTRRPPLVSQLRHRAGPRRDAAGDGPAVP